MMKLIHIQNSNMSHVKDEIKYDFKEKPAQLVEILRKSMHESNDLLRTKMFMYILLKNNKDQESCSTFHLEFEKLVINAISKCPRLMSRVERTIKHEVSDGYMRHFAKQSFVQGI
jgi:hypothetical protein